MRSFLGSPFASPAISALIWLVVSLATGGKVAFAVGGALILFVVVYAVQMAYRRAFMKGNDPS